MAVVTAVAGSGGAVAASDPTPPPPDPLAGLLGLLYGVVQTVEGVVGAIVPTGWLFDGSVDNPLRRSAPPSVPARMWQRGYTGKGIGVALVDTGVVPVGTA